LQRQCQDLDALLELDISSNGPQSPETNNKNTNSFGQLLGLSPCDVCGSIAPNPTSFDTSIYQSKYKEHLNDPVHKAYEQIHRKYAELSKVYAPGELRKKKAGAGSSNTKRKWKWYC